MKEKTILQIFCLFFLVTVQIFGQIAVEELLLELNFDQETTADNSIFYHTIDNINATLTEGISGQGLVLNGRDAYLSINTSDELLVPDQLTLSIWYKHEEQENRNAFYSLIEQSANEFGGHSRYGIWFQGNSYWGCIEPDACPGGSPLCQRCISTPVALEIGQWYHLAFTYNNDSQKLYLNGDLIEEKSYTMPTGISTRAYPLTIGTDIYDRSPVFLKGTIDEVKVYKTALDENDIRSLAEEFMLTSSHAVLPITRFFAYPNPTNGLLQLAPEEINGKEIMIYTTGGKLVAQVFTQNHLLDLSHLENGLYYLFFKSKGRLFSSSIILH